MCFWVSSAGFLIDFSRRFGGQSLPCKHPEQTAHAPFSLRVCTLALRSGLFVSLFTPCWDRSSHVSSSLFLLSPPTSPFLLSDCAFLEREVSFPVSGLCLQIHIHLPTKKRILQLRIWKRMVIPESSFSLSQSAEGPCTERGTGGRDGIPGRRDGIPGTRVAKRSRRTLSPSN